LVEPTNTNASYRQWTEDFPPEAEDDLVRHALEMLVALFRIDTSTGGLWRYIFDIHSETSHPISLKLTVTVTMPSSGTTLSFAERIV
jgi:hypothetical protein